MDIELWALLLTFGVTDVRRITGISKLYLNLLPMEGSELVRRINLGLAWEVGCSGFAFSCMRGFDCVCRRRMTDGMRWAACRVTLREGFLRGGLSEESPSFLFLQSSVRVNKALCLRCGFRGVDGWQISLVKMPVSNEELDSERRLCE